jgi:LysR family transcriptional regulator, malonate utilization transcriptional regulator
MAINEAITLRKLEVFVTYMSVNNLNRASELLGQSAVSVHRALHSLEEGLGCQLFKREGRGLTPLETAFVLVEHAKATIEACEEGVKRVRDIARVNAPRLHLGSLYSLTLHCIPRLVVGLKLRKPALDIILTMGSNRDLLRNLGEGKLDAVIIGLIEPLNDTDLIQVPLFDDTICLAAPLGSPYKDAAEIDLAHLKDEKFLALNAGFITSQSFFQAFERESLAPKIAMEVNDIFSMINLISEGIGYGLLPRRVGAFSSRIQLIPLSSRYASKQSITLVLSRNRERDPNLLALAAECRMYAKNNIPDIM